MSIHYDLYDTPDIQKKGEEQPLHPRVVFNGTIDQEEFLDRVHKFTGISRSLLVGAMQSFQNELRDLLANGWIVELGDIGYFSVSLQGPPVMKKKDVHAQSISLKNINFRAELTFKTNIRRDKWPRWMIKLHEYLTRIYDRPIPEVDYDDYDRLRRIIFEKIVILRKGMILNRTSIFVYIVKGDSGFGVVILRNNKVAITYYLE